MSSKKPENQQTDEHTLQSAASRHIFRLISMARHKPFNKFGHGVQFYKSQNLPLLVVNLAENDWLPCYE